MEEDSQPIERSAKCAKHLSEKWLGGQKDHKGNAGESWWSFM